MSTNMYQVQKVIGKKIVNNKIFYRVKWKDYPLDQSTWEVVSHLRYVQDLIDQYEKAQLQKTNESDRDKVSADKSSTQDQQQTNKVQQIHKVQVEHHNQRHQERECELANTSLEKEGRKKIKLKDRVSNSSREKKKQKAHFIQISAKDELKSSDRHQITKKSKGTFKKVKFIRKIQEEQDNLDSQSEVEEIMAQIRHNQKKQRKKHNRNLVPKGVPISIRLLQSSTPAPEIREYLVQYERGQLKVLTTVEMTLAHPFEFIEYLQQKSFKNGQSQ